MNRPMHSRLARLWLNGCRLLKKIAGPHPSGAFRILIFHDMPTSHSASFDRLLRYVVDVHGVLTPDEAESRLERKGKQTRDNRVPYLLTFDDGFESHRNVAKEILDRYDVKAIFFVCPGLMDVPREDQREVIATHFFDGCVRSADLPDGIALMSWSDLEDLVASGHTIGSHTAHHRRLSRLKTIEREYEILGSAGLLDSRLGISVRWFAYPFGDLGSIDRESFELIGMQYEFCCSGIRGVNSERTHPLGLLRQQLDLTSPFDYQRIVLEGDSDFFYAIRARRLQGLTGETILATRGCERA